MKKKLQNKFTIVDLQTLKETVDRIKEQQVKDYNKLWLMINDLKKKFKNKK